MSFSGFPQADIGTSVVEMIEKFKATIEDDIETEEDNSELKPHKPIISFTEDHTFHD